MVLESIMNPKKAEDNPLEVFLVSLVFTFIAIFFSHALFPSQSSILAVAFLTILFVPFFQKLFSIEEKKEDLAARKRLKQGLLKRHEKAIITFGAFFLGVIIAMSFVFIFFPEYGQVFYLQSRFHSKIAGASTDMVSSFSLYFLNNSQVMILSFIFSALFGAGAILIFAWNASIIAVYLGLITSSYIATGFGSASAYLYGITTGLLGIALHGIPEIAAYFLAGLAGGILSIALIRERFGSKEFKLVFKDAISFLIFAEVLIFVAAWIEATL